MKAFDEDFDNEQYGLVGGETATATSCSEGCWEFTPGDEVKVASRLTGDEHSYLGHFRQPEYAEKGHNTMFLDEPGLWPMQVGAAQGPAQSPGAGGRGPIGSALNGLLDKGIGALLGGIL